MCFRTFCWLSRCEGSGREKGERGIGRGEESGREMRRGKKGGNKRGVDLQNAFIR